MYREVKRNLFLISYPIDLYSNITSMTAWMHGNPILARGQAVDATDAATDSFCATKLGRLSF